MNELREQLAAHVHEIWSGWMRHVFNKAVDVGSNYLVIRGEDCDRWERQMATDYPFLTESEKDIDREKADGILKVIKQSGKKFCECGEKEQG